jgi:AcrR family transcriptional regulator
VTKQAGIVPTGFYRHFASMDELGIALVEESMRTLRATIRWPYQFSSTSTSLAEGSRTPVS